MPLVLLMFQAPPIDFLVVVGDALAWILLVGIRSSVSHNAYEYSDGQHDDGVVGSNGCVMIMMV